ncbi:PTS glucose transporter subunit IIA [Pseudonocardia nematodicida]|uniref:PTS glucose transporter subunit IIA n=1 Tax=Pseudonocardia nematodicida TaxID=1206997 RepID=A0ABV1K9D7_9PSEU
MTVQVAAPLAGRAVPLADVPDAVFAEQMLGSGVAIEPAAGSVTAVAPVAGNLAKVHPHAYVVIEPSGAGVLVHLGIDTVGLGDAAFTVHVSEGDDVAAGAPVVTMDVDAVRARGLSAICPVVLMESGPDGTRDHASGDVRPGDPLFSWEA